MAQASESDKVRSLDQLDVVVDCDSHVTDGSVMFDEIIEYMENDVAREQIDDSLLPNNNVFSTTLASPPFPDLLVADDGGLGIPQCTKPEHKYESMEEYGIDEAILDPTLCSALGTVNNDRYAVAIAQAYNSWLIDTFLDDNDGLQGTLTVAPQKPDKAAEEIDRHAHEDDIVGIQLLATGLPLPAGHEWYDPIYQAAEDHDLPVLMHSLSNSNHFEFPKQRAWAETFTEDHAIAHPFSHMWNMTTMMFRGVTERFDIDIVMQEAGIAWVPYMKWRLDDHYLESSHELPHLEKLPSEYIDDDYYFTTQPLGHTAKHPEHMAYAVEMAGPDNILFSSDHPHPDFDLPGELFDRIYSHFDGQTVRNIMGETAVDLFDL
ncbi:amidohydrolase family protein [Salinibaculum salinum]|uniref:amidohydrolase family protein n=1 Tax=Salinibaculum salinum TaxID=3131996 RepID=UPI0030EBD99F